MSSDDIEPEQPTWRRTRRWPVVALGFAILLVFALAWAGTYANAAWYDSVGYGDVYSTLAVTKAGLFGCTAVLVALAMGGSILLASRHRPAEMAGGSWVERYRAYAEPVRLWIWICITVIAALALGVAETSRWRDALLWWQGGSFGMRDPWFHHDVGFYVFTLPWLHDLIDLGLTLGLLALATSLAAHYFYGGITISPAVSWTRAAQRQLAAFGAVTLVCKAGDYWLARYDAVHAGGPYATGLGYVDQHATDPGREILTYAALICAGLLLWQWRRPRWRTPMVAVILLFISSATLTLIWPAILQSSVVRADPIAHERDNLTASIAATRAAYGLDRLTTGHLSGDAAATASLPILDPAQVRLEMKAVGAGTISPPELDRYVVDGKPRPVLVSMAQRGGTGGVLAAYADAGDRAGKARVLTTWAQNDLTHDLAASVAAPLYVGPDMVGGLARAGTSPGVPLTGINRVAYALANGDLGVLSERGTYATRLDPLQRAARVAPWLQLDRHPYLTIVGGRALWVIDGYTTTGNYPGSSVESWSGMTGDGTPGSSSAYDTVNYARDAVKITVDAQDGSVRLYEWDADPILHAWEGIFPGLVHTRAEIPPELQPHLRYPTDLFAVQRFQAQAYATATPDSLLAMQDTQIPTVGDGNARVEPQRAFVNGVWSVLSPMSAANGHDLASVLVANSDATSPDYGQLQWLTPSTTTPSPAGVNAIMRADPRVRAEIATFASSATPRWGPLLVTPTSAGPIWAASLYAVGTDPTTPPPLADVVVDVRGSVGVAHTIEEALAAAAKDGANGSRTAAALIKDANALLAHSLDGTLSPADRDALVQQAKAKLDAAAALLASTK
ncbi:UPF0182 protein [Nocardioides baekrokdamisoli]|uniref:UPF0182 protein n=1 Tax=Nocardioides baekrokdamisoli TaxID=1804624 RepID=A0A3G9IS55_9ACTN|nr:UPF0182 family protein [Nocardioides baekrokdamisoli]BBH16451.1 UPF0182 protein [Nocardioides baekrokdamisoli]